MWLPAMSQFVDDTPRWLLEAEELLWDTGQARNVSVVHEERRETSRRYDSAQQDHDRSLGTMRVAEKLHSVMPLRHTSPKNLNELTTSRSLRQKDLTTASVVRCDGRSCSSEHSSASDREVHSNPVLQSVSRNQRARTSCNSSGSNETSTFCCGVISSLAARESSKCNVSLPVDQPCLILTSESAAAAKQSKTTHRSRGRVADPQRRTPCGNHRGVKDDPASEVVSSGTSRIGTKSAGIPCTIDKGAVGMAEPQTANPCGNHHVVEDKPVSEVVASSGMRDSGTKSAGILGAIDKRAVGMAQSVGMSHAGTTARRSCQDAVASHDGYDVIAFTSSMSQAEIAKRAALAVAASAHTLPTRRLTQELVLVPGCARARPLEKPTVSLHAKARLPR